MLPEEIYVGKTKASKFKYSKPLNQNEKASDSNLERVRAKSNDIKPSNDEELIIEYNSSSKNSLALRKKIRAIKMLPAIGFEFKKAEKKRKSDSADAPSLFNKRSGVIKCSKIMAQKFREQYKKTA